MIPTHLWLFGLLHICLMLYFAKVLLLCISCKQCTSSYWFIWLWHTKSVDLVLFTYTRGLSTPLRSNKQQETYAGMKTHYT